MIAAARIDHASLVVDDLDRSVRFYRAAFGCEVVLRDDDLGELIASMTGQPGTTCALTQLRLPDSETLLELIAFPERRTDPSGGWGERPMAAGQGHFGLLVADLDAAQREVLEAGAVAIGATTTFPDGRSSYWREPGGSTFELSEAGA